MEFRAFVRDFRFKDNIKVIGKKEFIRLLHRWKIGKILTAKIEQRDFRLLPEEVQDLLLGLGFDPIRPTIF